MRYCANQKFRLCIEIIQGIHMTTHTAALSHGNDLQVLMKCDRMDAILSPIKLSDLLNLVERFDRCM